MRSGRSFISSSTRNYNSRTLPIPRTSLQWFNKGTFSAPKGVMLVGIKGTRWDTAPKAVNNKVYTGIITWGCGKAAYVTETVWCGAHKVFTCGSNFT